MGTPTLSQCITWKEHPCPSAGAWGQEGVGDSVLSLCWQLPAQRHQGGDAQKMQVSKTRGAGGQKRTCRNLVPRVDEDPAPQQLSLIEGCHGNERAGLVLGLLFFKGEKVWYLTAGASSPAGAGSLRCQPPHACTHTGVNANRIHPREAEHPQHRGSALAAPLGSEQNANRDAACSGCSQYDAQGKAI